MDLREDTLEKVLPFSSNVPLLCDELLLSRKCYPFERNPFLSNIVGKKSSAIGIKKLVDIAGEKTLNVSRPYLTIKNAINKTGEIYFETGTFVDEDDINNYNNSLSNWEKMNGFCINNESGLICISSYETRTLNILRELIKYSKKENKGQEVFNKNYLKNSLNYHIHRACVKLRGINAKCKGVSIFLRTKDFRVFCEKKVCDA